MTLKIHSKTSSALKIHIAALQMASSRLKREGANTDFLDHIIEQLENLYN
jgi:hypothetical protein